MPIPRLTYQLPRQVNFIMMEAVQTGEMLINGLTKFR